MIVTGEHVWVELHQQLRGFVARRVANPADVDDLLQEIFVRIHTRIDSLNEAERIQAWVYQIARNAIADYYRARAAQRRREQRADDTFLDTVDAADVPEEDAERAEAELARCMTPLLNGLPEPYRTALELTDLQGLTQQEAAGRLGLTHSGMKSRVQRGRRQMRERLLACCEVELDRRGGVIDYTVQESSCGCANECGCQN